MDDFFKLAKKMQIVVSILFLIILIVGLFIFKDSRLSYSIGLFLGSLFTIFKIHLNKQSIIKITDLEKQSAENYKKMSFLFNYFLTGALLVTTGILSNNIFEQSLFLGSVIGILLLPIAGFIIGFMIKDK